MEKSLNFLAQFLCEPCSSQFFGKSNFTSMLLHNRQQSCETLWKSSGGRELVVGSVRQGRCGHLLMLPYSAGI